jgi:hypothetical protein
MENGHTETYYSRQTYGEGKVLRPLKAWHEIIMGYGFMPCHGLIFDKMIS